jgi:protease-4
VLYVDSPGGSALASDLIHRELLRLREKKPVVTCMGDVAASGGYYVAAATERIVAQPLTITGSIGVIAGRLLARDLLAKVGVRTEVIRTAPHADMFSIARDADAEEQRILDAQVATHYDAFVRLVAEGRNRPLEEIEPLARGRVWSGAAARERGLVDRLGGLDAAIDEVRTRVKASERVRRRLEPKLIHESRGPLPPIPPSATLAAATELVPDLLELARLLRSGSGVMFYATGIPRIR